MIPLLTLLALAASLLVHADPTPTQPSPGDSFNAGGSCPIAWEVDTTGVWKTMNIELMTGSNLAMVHLTTVATVDGTNPTATTFEYPCPAVTPNSAIYFYQFSTPVNSTQYWTGRFTLANAQGGSTPPTQMTQPGTNAPIPWGTGALVDPADAKPPPAGGGTAANSTAASSVVVPSSSSAIVAPPVSSQVNIVTSSSDTPSSTSAPSATVVAGSSQGNGASGLTMDRRMYIAGVLFVATGVLFGGLL